MNQKHVGIIILLLIVSGLFTAGVNQIKKDSVAIITTPTPSPTALQFNQLQSQPTINQKQSKKSYAKFPGLYSPADLKNKKAILQTSKGYIEFEIYPEATKAASNFIFLSQEGFYDSLSFHRVEKGFVIQGGDPLGNGTGGPGYQFEDEPVTRNYDRGIVAMANSGPNTNGSQFFIMLDDVQSLPPKYTIFGKVIKGLEVVDNITIGDQIISSRISPLSNI